MALSESGRMDLARAGRSWHVRRATGMVYEALAALSIFLFLYQWNDFIWPLLVTNSVQMRTLPIGLMALKESEGVDNWGAIMAGTTMVVLPMLLLFLFAQRFIVAGLAGASVRR